MRLTLFLLIFITFSYNHLFAAQLSDDYYRISNVKIQVLDIFEPLNSGNSPLLTSCDPKTHTDGIVDIISDIKNGAIILDLIENIGKKIWVIVSAGKPVANINTNIAHALPAGVTCWLDLDSWKPPRVKEVAVVYENYLGMKVIEFTYRVSFVYGGHYNGMGDYITEATVLPAKLNVAWGFKLNADVDVPIVFNLGTKENPVAGMQVNIKWAAESPISHKEQTDSYLISGDGAINSL